VLSNNLFRRWFRRGWQEDKVVQLERSLGRAFWQDQQGQDLVEYSLLMAFVCLASVALFIGVGKSIAGIFGVTSTSLSQAYSAANSSS
jgi:Flp pilus assembly pilin Flp